jgi:2-polyprenyl-3-methyl-5-hydroxy-6-metoxy-1,4-benzoquinol methylase
MDRWQKPRIEIATKYKDDDLAYATYGMAQAALVLHKLDLPPSELKKLTILDYGCGTGVTTRCLSMFFKTAFGYDPSVKCIEVANEEHQRASGLVPPILYTPYLSNISLNCCDVVICSNVFQHLEPKEEEEAIKNIFAYLKPDGTAIVWIQPSKNKHVAKLFGVDQNLACIVHATSRKV